MSADDVLTFLRLLDSRPKSHRTWRLVQCHCRRCDDLAVEVFRTPVESAALVAVCFGLKREPGQSILGVADKAIRANDPTVTVLWTDIQDGIAVACKCGKRVVPVSLLLGAVRAGERRVILEAPG